MRLDNKAGSVRSMLVAVVFMLIVSLGLFVFLASGLVTLGTTTGYPNNNSWSTNGTFSVYCRVNLTSPNWAPCTGAGECNLTNVSLWSNITGAWVINQTNTSTNIINGSSVNFTMSGLGSARRQDFAWNCSLANNTPGADIGFIETSGVGTAGSKTFGVDRESPAFKNLTVNNATHVSSYTNFLFRVNVSDFNPGNITINYRRSGTTVFKSNVTNCHSIPVVAGPYVSENNCSVNVNLLQILGLGAAQGLTIEYKFNGSDVVNNTNETPISSMILDIMNPWINSTSINFSGAGANLASGLHSLGTGPIANVSGMITVNISASDDGAGIRNVSLRWVNGTAGASYGFWESLDRMPGSDNYIVDIDTTTFSPGLLNLSINVTDNATNSNSTFNITIFVDNSAPLIKILSPTGNSTNASSTFNLTVSVNDSVSMTNVDINGSGIRNVSWYWINGSGSGAATWLINFTNGPTNGHVGYYYSSIDVSTFADGLLNITVNATDWAGNTRLQNETIVVDNTAPNATALATIYEGVLLSFPSIINVTNITRNTTGYFTINVSVNDSRSGIRNVTLYWINVSPGGSGPSLRMTNGTDFISSVTSSATFNFTVDASNFADGLLNITVNATDWAGNSRLTNVTFNITSDRSPMVFTSPSPVTRSNISATLRMFSVNVHEFNLNMSKNVTLFYRVQTGGVSSWTRSKMLNCTGFAPDYNCNTTIDLAGDLSIAHGDIIEYMFNGTDATSDGSTSGWVSSNGTSATPLNATIDSRNPWYNASNSPTSGGNISGTITLNVTVSDDYALSSVTYHWVNRTGGATTSGALTAMSRTSGTMFYSASVDVSGYVDVAVNFTINVTDTAGNSNYSWANISVTVDNTRPNLALVSPLAGSNYTNQSASVVLNVSVNDTGSKVRNVSWYWFNRSGATGPVNQMTNVSEITEGSSSYTEGWFNFTVNLLAFPDGLINITINATDWAGSTNLTNVTILVDHTNATVDIVTPVNGSNFSASFLLNASINDSFTGQNASGLRYVFWYWANSSRSALKGMDNASNHPSANNGTIGYFNATVSGFDNGGLFIGINVTDWSGNVNGINSNVSVMIDLVSPNITAVSSTGVLLNGSYTNNVSGVFVLNISVNDSFSLLRNVSWYWINSSGSGPVNRMTTVTATANTAIASGFFNYTVNGNEFTSGLLNITINATDWAGNTRLSNITITVDNTAPNISILSPSNSSTVIGDVVINVTVNDTAGIRSVHWYWVNQSAAGATQKGPLNGFTQVSPDTTANGTSAYFNTSINTRGFANAEVNITVNATDWAGNQMIVKATITTSNAQPILSNWSYNESSKVLTLGFDKTIDLTRGVAVSNISINFSDGSIADGVANLANANSSSTTNSSSVFIRLTSGQDAAIRKIKRNDATGKVNITVYGIAVTDTGANGNVINTSQYKRYTMARHESPAWPSSITSNRVTIPQTSTLTSWGWNSTNTNTFNISTVLSIGGLGSNYNVVYYNTDGTASGWKVFSRTDWVGSTLQYVNNSNDKDYEINMTGTARFELCCQTLT